MKLFQALLVILLCLACSNSFNYLRVEAAPEFNSVAIIESARAVYCYDGKLAKNIQAFYFDSPSDPGNVVRNPPQDWINNYFAPQIENKLFHYSISFPNDTVAVRLFIPASESTLIRQAFISESEIFKLIGSDSYSSGYQYPPNKELHISWDLTDSLGVRVPAGWYAFITEFVEEDKAILFWFYVFDFSAEKE